MKSKLVLGWVGVSAAFLACSAWWMGCSSDSSTVSNASDSGAGTETGTGSETGTSSEAGTDAGADSATTTVEITGPLIDLKYKGCAPLAACGGDVKGLWRLTSGCVDEGAFAAAKAQCAGLVESNVKFQARGVVFADATTVQRKTEIKLSATFAVPVECKMGNPLGTTCKDAEAAVKFSGIDSATCKDAAAGGGCDCDVADDTVLDTNDAYTTAGNTLTSGNQTFDYCVAGNDIQYKETTAKAIPAVFTLTK